MLLGTAAGPVPGRTRKMTSHAMLNNGTAYVLDCGLGVTDQFARTGIPFSALKSIFITHHHADHNIEYGPLLIVGWIQGLPLDVRAFGPPPLKQSYPLLPPLCLHSRRCPVSAASKHHKRHTKAATAAQQPQIACTVVGCIPVPRGCHPEMATRRGEHQPVFDVAACPGYTLYGNRR